MQFPTDQFDTSDGLMSKILKLTFVHAPIKHSYVRIYKFQITNNVRLGNILLLNFF